ncbi:MAG: hypothetical protein GY804_14490 [Alphaproteobacteria bacterium]|nr:hypothetical protein [Alphaproteobacteria bacterium]
MSNNKFVFADVLALAKALGVQGKIKEAEEVWKGILKSELENTALYLELATLYVENFMIDEAKALMEEAFAYSLPLTKEQYKEGVTAKHLLERHKNAAEERFAYHLAQPRPEFKNLKDANKKLKIGFVSVGFGKYAVGHLTLQAFKNFVWDDIDIYLFAARDNTDDEMTAEFKAIPNITWINVEKLSNAELQQLIIGNEIDVLFNMDGLWQPNYLPVFALRAAPVQIAWADYPGTTGLAEIDYLLADRYQVPECEEAEACYIEKIIRMPNDYICYTPLKDASEVSTIPCLKNGYITFGAFHNPSKVSDSILRVWGDILQSLDNSKIYFKYKDYETEEVQNPILDILVGEKGIARDRIIFEGKTPLKDHLQRYAEIDIYLDSAPYSAGLTACETMYMGVPVITCPGDTFASRHAYSHVMNAGLSNIVAYNFDEYKQQAISLAKDTEYLSHLRKSLRDNVLRYPLSDGQMFAGYFHALMRSVWQEYCDNNV